jgi:hypothetical protein
VRFYRFAVAERRCGSGQVAGCGGCRCQNIVRTSATQVL